MKGALIYEYNDKLLGIALILCPFSRTMLEGSPLETMTSLAINFGSHNVGKFSKQTKIN